ncbi:hypothetical protein PG984_004713 [Apiospora sp. TS-2023a]
MASHSLSLFAERPPPRHQPTSSSRSAACGRGRVLEIRLDPGPEVTADLMACGSTNANYPLAGSAGSI